MDNVERVKEAIKPFAEPLLTNQTEVSKDISELKVGKALHSNGLSDRSLRNIPRKAVTISMKVFNAVFKWQPREVLTRSDLVAQFSLIWLKLSIPFGRPFFKLTIL